MIAKIEQLGAFQFFLHYPWQTGAGMRILYQS